MIEFRSGKGYDKTYINSCSGHHLNMTSQEEENSEKMPEDEVSQ
jgi:hypothetical protein